MQSTTFWGWSVKGLGGAANIISLLIRDRCPISKHWLEELKKIHGVIGELIVHAGKNVE